MIPVNNRKAKTLIPIIKKWILPGSIIHSDCWKAYNSLKNLGNTHVTVNHSKEFIDRSSAACTNAIESDWRHTKVHMPPYGLYIRDHAGYLAEFMWRRANCDKNKFLTLLNDINMTFNEKYLHSVPSTSSWLFGLDCDGTEGFLLPFLFPWLMELCKFLSIFAMRCNAIDTSH